MILAFMLQGVAISPWLIPNESYTVPSRSAAESGGEDSGESEPDASVLPSPSLPLSNVKSTSRMAFSTGKRTLYIGKYLI